MRRALEHGEVIDITTTGRRTGLSRRIEIVYHVVDGRTASAGSATLSGAVHHTRTDG